MFTRGRDLRVLEATDPLSWQSLRLLIPLDLKIMGLGEWRLVFDNTDPDENCRMSHPVDITRIGDTQWVIESITGFACLKRSAGGGEFTFAGLYDMPFRITVELLP